MDRIKQFTEFRQRMNERILAEDNQVVRRFFALDTQAFEEQHKHQAGKQRRSDHLVLWIAAV